MTAQLLPINYPKPNEELILLLERLLVEAKRGEMRTFVGAANYNNGDVVNLYSADKLIHAFALIGALTVSINTLMADRNMVNDCFEDA